MAIIRLRIGKMIFFSVTQPVWLNLNKKKNCVLHKNLLFGLFEEIMYLLLYISLLALFVRKTYT